jgi:hypothetical protein
VSATSPAMHAKRGLRRIVIGHEPSDNPPIVNDLGLRITGQHGRRVIGTLMAKVNGKWTEVQLAPQDSFAAQH